MFTLQTRWFLDRKHVIKRLGAGKAKALRSAGALVYRSVQKQFDSGTPSRNGVSRPVGQFRGLPLIEKRTRTKRSAKVISWRSPRGHRFMRSAVAFAYDPSSESVVIGPRKMQSQYSPTLYELHERGGSQTQRMYLRFRGRPIPRQRAYGLRRTGSRSNLVYVGTFMNPRPTTSNFRPIGLTRTVRVRPGRYQQKGLDAVRAKIPRKFRDQITGP